MVEKSNDAPVRIGRYAILRTLGRGGMGIVYAARDERLRRTVALKTMTAIAADEDARRRVWREARAAASVSHPHVCQLFEIGEEDGELYLTMELLEGEPLSDRLRRGPCTVSEALPIGLAILSALSALHAKGIVHRDLKPSNVFLTAHGPKLLDFGLARPMHPASAAVTADLTRTGFVAGTPRYTSPERLAGEAPDGRADLFAVGAILFEMLAGRPAFAGRTAVEVWHAILHEHPPALTGSPAVAAVDRAIRRALAKDPAQRTPDAEAMAVELSAVRGAFGDETPVLARALTRLVVLPFRVLRPDPETDFLAFSLPDAIVTSLAGQSALIVRSSATAARFDSDAPDLKALAAEADVDCVVMGSLVRAGGRLQATAQIVEAPSGTLLSSQSIQSSLDDLFRLQDDIARRVSEALSLPVAAAPITPESPQDARAYDLYLRANALARHYEQLVEARALYERCLEMDPGFAPAWAQLARCHRVIGKYLDESGNPEARAEEALQRALALSPRLAAAHKIYAGLEADTGQPRAALARLLGEASRHGNDPELFAGLVHACRYCGLFEQSLAAHREARRLDPGAPTSHEQTLLMMGDIVGLLAVRRPHGSGSGDEMIRAIGLGLAGRRDEARHLAIEIVEATAGADHPASRIPAFLTWTSYLLAWLERRTAEMIAIRSGLGNLKVLDDPEAVFQEGWLLCDAGEHARGLPLLERAVARGYAVAPSLRDRPAFDALRGVRAFEALVAEAEARRQDALATFRESGGIQLLGA